MTDPTTVEVPVEWLRDLLAWLEFANGCNPGCRYDNEFQRLRLEAPHRSQLVTANRTLMTPVTGSHTQENWSSCTEVDG